MKIQYQNAKEKLRNASVFPELSKEWYFWG